jgi:RNA polymerase sigma-70 factor, ECF subfamily
MASHTHTDNCKEVFALLSEYLDLELPPEACAEIEAHIAGCQPCIEFTESLRRTVDLCRQYQPSELPEAIGQQARGELLRAYREALAARAGGNSAK